MNIIRNGHEKQTFSELNVGECFAFSDCYYMKTEPLHDEHDSLLNCVCLENGNHYHIKDNFNVDKVVIEGRVIA